MTNLQKEQIRESLQKYLRTGKMEVIIKKAEIGGKVIVSMLNGEWDGLRPEWWEQVGDALDMNNMDGLYTTKDCEKVMKICRYATDNCIMIGLTGDTGMGKTHALRAVALRENVFYTELDLTTNPRVFLRSILQNMNIGYDGTVHNLLQRVVTEINRRKNVLLIVDEAGKMNHRIMLCLHTLRDRTNKSCGIVLAGMPEFKNNLIRGKDSGKGGYAEFFRRVNLWDELTGLDKEEVIQVLADNGITDASLQREFTRYRRFGDLMNEIQLFQVLKAD